MFDPVTRTINPAPGLEKRVNPITEAGTIYRDNNGVTRAIMVLQMNEQLLQAFESSGFNLAKAVLSELIQFGKNNHYLKAVTENWDAQFDSASRFLHGTTYMSLALTCRGAAHGGIGATLMLQNWLEQGAKYFMVEEVENALNINKRSTVDSSLEEEAGFPSPWCNAPVGGIFNIVVDKAPEFVDIKVACPA